MKSNEWYTPAKYIEAARQVMGRIDLDPASCEEANLTVKATRYYDKTQNGLMQPWWGCVWLNPPYGFVNGGTKRGFSSSLQAKFVEKFLRESLEQGILLLLGNSCFNSYFVPLWEYPVCFHRNTIAFERSDGSKGVFGFGTIFVYIGPHEQRFIDIFSRFGTVARRVSVPRPTPIMLELF